MEGIRPQQKEATFRADQPGSIGTRPGGGYTAGEESQPASVHEQLVAGFRSELARAKEGAIFSITEEGGAERKMPAFNTAAWFRRRLFQATNEAIQDDSVSDEEHKFYYDLGYSWEAVAYTQLSEKQQQHVRYGAIEYVLREKRDSVTLPPRGVQLLDAMAEVVELPDYQPGRTEIPLPLETMLGEKYGADLRETFAKKG